MQRRIINLFLLLLTIAIVVIMGKDFIGNNAGKNQENPFKFNVDEYRKVDPTMIRYHEAVTFPVNAEGLSGLAVSDSAIWISTETNLLSFDFQGKELLRKELKEAAKCVALAPDGKIWIGTLHGVITCDQKGDIVNQWNSFGERSVITSLAVSREAVYVADAGNRIVYRCDPDGKIVSKVGEKDELKGVPGYIIPSAYFEVALDTDGFLWVANTGRHKLENYDTDGSIRKSWGESSINIQGFSGCCNPSHFAILADNSFITSEKGIVRIKHYSSEGKFLSVVASPEQFNDGSRPLDIAIDKQQRIVALDMDRKQIRIFEKNQDGNK